jgi:hypothetical protein
MRYVRPGLTSHRMGVRVLFARMREHDNLARMDVEVLHLTCVQIFIIGELLQCGYC